MHTVREEIEAAVLSLKLSPHRFYELPEAQAKSVIQQALDRFVTGGDRRSWWEAFKDHSVSRRVTDGWKLITTLVSEPNIPAWFIAQDDQSPFNPVYEATPTAAAQVVGECFGFEYYLIGKDMSWLLCENHHDLLIGVGEPVTIRFAKLPN